MRDALLRGFSSLVVENPLEHLANGEIEFRKCTESARLHSRTGDRYAFEPRGEIVIKGKGRRAAYLLTGLLASG